MSNVMDWTRVEQAIEEGESVIGAIGVTVTSSNGGDYSYNGDRQFGAASIVKIPIMIELFRQVDRGERSLEDIYHLRNEDRAVGTGVMLELHEGMPFTLKDLIYLMISISDNTATNVLIDMAGMEQIDRTMKALGMKRSTLGRKMQNRPADGKQKENWGTPNDYTRLIIDLLDGHTASPAATAEMVTMLQKQQTKRRIARYLPESEKTRWGSKPGSIAGVTNDVGFVESDKGRLAISVFCEDPPDQHTGEKVIGDITRAALIVTGIVEPLMVP